MGETRWLLLAPVQVIFNILGWCLVLIPMLVISLPYWIICRFLVWVEYGVKRKQVTGMATYFMHDQETSRSVATAVAVVGGASDPNMVDELHRMMMVFKSQYPQTSYVSYPETIYNYFFWKDQEDFHFRNHWYVLDGVDPDKTYTQTEVLQLYGDRVHNRAFPKGQPMWEVNYVPKFVFDDEVGKPGVSEKECFFLRTHHSVGDAISLVKVVNRYFLGSKKDYDPIPPLPSIPMWKMFLIHSASIFNIPWTLAPFCARRLWNSSRLPSLNGHKILCTVSLDIEMIRFIKRKAGCNFSDVVLSSVGATLQDFFRKRDFCPGIIHSGLSLAYPSKGDDIITHNFTGVLIPFSGCAMDPLSRLRDTQKMVANMKQSLEALTMFWFLKALGYILPISVYGNFASYLDAFALVSYIPGRGLQLEYEGRKFVDGFFTSMHRDKTGIAVTASTYMNNLRVNILVDGALVKGREEVQEMCDIFYKNTSKLALMLGYKNGHRLLN